MRSVLAFAIMLCLAGCETSPLGGRCTSNLDCDRSTTGATAHCVLASNTAASCNGTNCICCPITVVGGDSGVMNCGPGAPIVDSGPVAETGVDVVVEASVEGGVDATADTGSDVTTTCACAAGTFCNGTALDGGFVCSPQRAIGLACTATDQCQTGHCVDGVCCNSACTGAGLSCNVSPDFAGLCTAEPTTVDAGTDAGTDAATE